MEACEDLWQNIVEIFNREPLEKQPEAMIHVGCGDGSVLKEIFRVISSRTVRGQHLADMPVHLVGIDNDSHNLEATAKALAGVAHQTLLFDINKPDEVNAALEQIGITREQKALHLRILIDRIVAVDGTQPLNKALTVLAADQSRCYLDAQGQVIDAVTVLNSWQQYLRTLAPSVLGARLLVITAHDVSSHVVDQRPEESNNGDAGWVQRLSKECHISAEAFITLAASVGLFNDDCVKRYPQTSDPCQISLHSFTRRDYIVRHATENDLETLWQLEQLCWQHTQTPMEQIRSRISGYPQGQFVLEKDGKVLGAIYSQRIASFDEFA